MYYVYLKKKKEDHTNNPLKNGKTISVTVIVEE